MAAYKRANRQQLTGALISAGLSLGMAKIGAMMDTSAMNAGQEYREGSKAFEGTVGIRRLPTAKEARGMQMLDQRAAMQAYRTNPFSYSTSGAMYRPPFAQGGSTSSSITPIKPINRAYGGGTGTSMSPSMPMANTSTGVGGGSGAFAMLASSIQQLSASIQSNGGSTGGGGETTVNLTFNIDKSGKAEAKDGENKQGMDSKKKSTEDEKQERQLGDMMKVVVLQTLNEQKRPGGILYQS